MEPPCVLWCHLKDAYQHKLNTDVCYIYCSTKVEPGSHRDDTAKHPGHFGGGPWSDTFLTYANPKKNIIFIASHNEQVNLHDLKFIIMCVS